MADVKRESSVRIFTTPDELRELADEMEAFWKRCQWGQDTTAKVWLGEDVQVCFSCDQERMPRNEHGLGRSDDV